MNFTGPARSNSASAKPTRWLRAWSVLLLSAVMFGPATGLSVALHYYFAHGHNGDLHAPIHDCVVCHAARAPLATSPSTPSVGESVQVGITHDQPRVSTGWSCLVLIDARGPPPC